MHAPSTPDPLDGMFKAMIRFLVVVILGCLFLSWCAGCNAVLRRAARKAIPPTAAGALASGGNPAVAGSVFAVVTVQELAEGHEREFAAALVPRPVQLAIAAPGLSGFGSGLVRYFRVAVFVVGAWLLARARVPQRLWAMRPFQKRKRRRISLER